VDLRWVQFLRHTRLTPSPRVLEKVCKTHGWVKPFCQLIIVSLESLDLMMNEGENGAGRGTVLELDDKWMRKEIILGTFFVSFQGIVEN
jgi:hypothetical protein